MNVELAPHPSGEPSRLQEEARYALTRIRLRYPVFETVWVRAYVHYDGGIEIHAHAAVPERSTGKTSGINAFTRIDPGYTNIANQIREVAEGIRSLIQQLLLHELDEMLEVDGVLLHDPHASG